MQCPRCGSHRDHVYIFAKGINNSRWYIERCAREDCGFNFDAWTQTEYRAMRDNQNKDDKQRNLRLPPPQGWQFGL